MATAPKLVTDTTPRTLNVKKGDQVRLLLPLWDNVQRYEMDEIIAWPFDYAPSIDQACLPEEKVPALTAPAMGDGKPPEGYVDARTGRPLVIPSG